MKKEYNDKNGKYSIYIEREIKTLNVVIKECKNKEAILNEIYKIADEYSIQSIKVGDNTEVFFGNRKEDYQINRYVISNPKKVVKDYSHEIVTKNNALLYIDITNAATRNIDNMSYVDNEEVNKFLGKKDCTIGFINYKNNIIGTFIIDGACIKSFCITPEHRGKKLSLNALYYIMNLSSSDGIYLYCSTRNHAAMNLYKKAGFKLSVENKTNKFYVLR